MKALGRRWDTIADSTRVRVARTMMALAALVGAISVYVYIAAGEAGYLLLEGELFNDWVLHNVVLGAFGIGLLVWFAIPSQPRNGAVWALAWSALFQAINAGANAWTVAAADAAGIVGSAADVPIRDLPLSVAFPQQLAAWSWVPGVLLLLTLVLLLLPAGKLPSRRWLPVAWGSVAAMLALVVGFIWWFRPGQDTFAARVSPVPTWLELLFVPMMASVLACTAGLVVRYRRSTGEDQVRLRWIAWGGAMFGLSFVLFPIGAEGLGGQSLFGYIVFVSGIAMLAAFYIAITKHRLYDIDVVVSRSLALGLLAGLIGGLYVAVVYGFGTLVGGDEISFDVQVIATVAVAIAFQPARRRAQAWANRAVYGQRATPYEILAKFSHGAAEASDDELMERIPRLIVDGTAAAEATIWLEAGDAFRAAGSSDETPKRFIPSATGFVDPEADYSVPIYHDGELLGGLSLVTSHGEDLLPPEQQLIEQLAAGLGLALRNARLTSQLRHQVAELEASRERILAAADDARRDLERDLDSGPQQRLVALKVMLGPTRIKAEQAGATKTAKMVAQLEAEAGEAIKAVRDFSSGVYPPLLEAEGIVVAIRQRVGKASFPITIEERGLGRYPREVEAAVYFAILEALQNIAKYASASEVDVVIGDVAGELSFSVSDNGIGFDSAQRQAGSGLANMADRLDAVGGVLAIESAPGEGTVVSGSVPVAVPAPV